MRNLKIRWKLLAVSLPLVLVPVVIVGGITGYIANEQAHIGVTQASRDGLVHLTEFTIDLLEAHRQQFQVYKADKRETINRDLATLAEFAYKLVVTQHRQFKRGLLDEATAQGNAREALRGLNIGETGYVYALRTNGDLAVHVALEGRNIWDAQDQAGRHFIRDMIATVQSAAPGDVHTIVYPWRNEILGDTHAREKVVAYKYFAPWDWIVAAGSYLEEAYDDTDFERRAFEELSATIGRKKVGETGYIFAMDSAGVLRLHPFHSGESVWDSRDDDGHYFAREMCQKKRGWMRYPWRNEGDPAPRMKLAYYDYFEPWDWIVAAGSYEDEFYRQSSEIERRLVVSISVLTLLVGLAAVIFAFVAAKVLTDPIGKLIEAVRAVRRGRLDVNLAVRSGDELGELARNVNEMVAVLRENRELEESLAQQEKLASLGVLSSGVAHDINNPLGVILGYASHVESKLSEDDPNLRYVREIKAETKRCKNIVQELLGYARLPRPEPAPTDVNALLDQVLSFAGNHEGLRATRVVKDFSPELPLVTLDKEQIRRAAINLVLNAGEAMASGGRLRVATRMSGEGWVELIFQDDGQGIAPEEVERVFRPFYTTRTRGTGLGLSIVKGIVEQHGGRIRIDSGLGRGTTVTICLPV